MTSPADPSRPDGSGGMAEPVLDRGPAAVAARYSGSRPPRRIHQAFLVAVGVLALDLLGILVDVPLAVVLDSGYGVGAVIGGVLARLVVFVIVAALAGYVAIHMRDGYQWARISLAVLAGIGALVAMVRILDQSAVVGFAGFLGVVALLVSLGSLALCAACLLVMFRPASINTYFR